MKADERLILRRKDVAILAGVHPATVDRWARKGAIQKKTIGGQARASGFHAADVYRFLGK